MRSNLNIKPDNEVTVKHPSFKLFVSFVSCASRAQYQTLLAQIQHLPVTELQTQKLSLGQC